MWINGISVVVPIYNEQNNIEPLTTEIVHALEPYSHAIMYEIIYVDDSSTDGSAQIVTALQHQYPSVVRTVRHTQNRGQSAAVVSGVKAARYPWIATLDGDRQNNPEDLPALIRTVNQYIHPRVLCMGQRQKRQDSRVRKLSSWVANRVRACVLKDECQDSGCGIKIFPRAGFLSLPLFKNCHRFLPTLFRRAGYTVLYVPVSHRPRVEGVSKYGIRNRLGAGLLDLLGVAWLMHRFIDDAALHDEGE